MVNRIECPCKDCEKKGCGTYHDICKAYQQYKKANEQYLKERAELNSIEKSGYSASKIYIRKSRRKMFTLRDK